MIKQPRRELYEKQFIKLMAKGMLALIEERIAKEKVQNENFDDGNQESDSLGKRRLCS